jgi:predicted GIY-YIG superfamily endonuclease
MEYIKPKLPIHEFPCGVYKLIFNDKWFYIGSTQDIKKRFVRWKTGLRQPKRFLAIKKVREIIATVTKVEIQILKICDDYREQEAALIKENIGNPFSLNHRVVKREIKPKIIKEPVILMNSEQIEEAKRLREDGWILKDLANRYKVSIFFIQRKVKGIEMKVKRKAAKRKISVVPSRKPIVMFDLKGNEVKRFISVKEAVECMGTSVVYHLRGKAKCNNYKGFTFKFVK